MKNQFFISGLGADKKAFSKLGDFGTNKIFIEWLRNHDNESLHSYCQRLIDQYNIQQGDLLVGLSFGGLIAQQISEIVGIDKGGSHFMVYEQAEAVSNIIRNFIA